MIKMDHRSNDFAIVAPITAERPTPLKPKMTMVATIALFQNATDCIEFQFL